LHYPNWSLVPPCGEFDASGGSFAKELVGETLSELEAELLFQERRISKIQQHPELGHSTVDCANKIAGLREKIKKVEDQKSNIT
jgi:hypothetical protein